MIWLNRQSSFSNLLEIFFPELVLSVGIIYYLVTFFFSDLRLYKTSFGIYFSILLTTLFILVVSPRTYNFESYIISTNMLWLVKIFLIIFVIIFTISHFLQVRFAWFFNVQIDIELGSKYFEYNLIILVLLLSSFITITANDFLLFLVGLEVVSIGLYILTGLTYERISVEAALKYFFPGVFFSLIIILGISLIFWAYGTLNFFELKNLMFHLDNLATGKIVKLYGDFFLYYNNDLNFLKILNGSTSEITNSLNMLSFDNSDDFLVLYDILQNQYFTKLFNNLILNDFSSLVFQFFQSLLSIKLKWLFLGFSLIFFGLLGKLGVFPGHFWVLDVYYGTSTLTNFFISIFPKIFYLILIIKFRILFDFLFTYTPINFIFIISGFLSILYGVSITLDQWRIKKFLAGSSIVNIGFIILFLGIDTNYYFLISDITVFSDNAISANNLREFSLLLGGDFYMQLVIIYFNLFIYLISLSIFFFYYLILRQPSNVKTTYYLDDLRDFGLLKYSNITFLILLSLIFLSFAGIPPLSGFFSKFLLFEFLMHKKQYFLLIYLIIVSIITAFYYLRVVRVFLFNTNDNFGLFIYENSFILKGFLFFSYIFFFIVIFFFNFIFNILFNFLISDLFFLIYF